MNIETSCLFGSGREDRCHQADRLPCDGILGGGILGGILGGGILGGGILGGGNVEDGSIEHSECRFNTRYTQWSSKGSETSYWLELLQ